MNIFAVIEINVGEKISTDTEESLKENKIPWSSFTKEGETNLYYKNLQLQIMPEFKIDFILLLKNGSILNSSFNEIVKEHITKKSKVVYLPLVTLITNDLKGVLNSSIWSPQVLEYGKLDHSFAMYQTDTTLYGALISRELFFNKDNYKEDLEYYQHFYFLNKITDSEDIEVIGIPKILSDLKYDLSFPDIDSETKVKFFKMAYKDWENQSFEDMQTIVSTPETKNKLTAV